MKLIVLLSVLCTFSVANASPFKTLSGVVLQPQMQRAERVTNCIDLSGSWVGTCQSTSSTGHAEVYEDTFAIEQLGCQYLDFQYDYFEMGQITAEVKGSNVYAITLDWLPGGTEITYISVNLNSSKSGDDLYQSYGSSKGRLYLENGAMKTVNESSFTTIHAGQEETSDYTSTCSYNRI